MSFIFLVFKMWFPPGDLFKRSSGDLEPLRDQILPSQHSGLNLLCVCVSINAALVASGVHPCVPHHSKGDSAIGILSTSRTTCLATVLKGK